MGAAEPRIGQPDPIHRARRRAGGHLYCTKLVARVQTVACAVAILRWMFCATGALQPIWIYLSVGMLEITSRLESSARSSIIASVVEKDALPNAVTIVQITQYAGEVLAPFSSGCWRTRAAAPAMA